MVTVNVVLLAILCLMVGFTAGNAFGKESMKRTLRDVLNQLINGLKLSAEKLQSVNEKKEE